MTPPTFFQPLPGPKMNKPRLDDARNFYESIKNTDNPFDGSKTMDSYRHNFVAKALRVVHAYCVLDYGCGDGRVLSKVVFPPGGTWYGMDFVDRSEPFLTNAEMAHISARFIMVPPDRKDYVRMMLEFAKEREIDTIVISGVFGYEGFLSLDQIHQMAKQCNVIATVPLIWEREDHNLVRFPWSSLQGFDEVHHVFRGVAGVIQYKRSFD